MNDDLLKIRNKVAQTLIEASVSFRPDQIKAYQQALGKEENVQARWVLDNILANAAVGARDRLPLCDDTGIPHLFLEIGDEAALPRGFFSTLEQGVRQGLRELPGRPMAVKGDDLARLDQSEGMFEDSGLVDPAPLQLRYIPGNEVRLTVLMYGGGPEIRGKTLRVFHKHSTETVRDEMIAWGMEGVKLLGCQPVVLSFGIGRSNLEAAVFSLEAMATGCFGQMSQLEHEITEALNASAVGPLGLGGKTTALATFIKIGPQRASGVRIVSLRVGCCFDPRRATCSWRF